MQSKLSAEGLFNNEGKSDLNFPFNYGLTEVRSWDQLQSRSDRMNSSLSNKNDMNWYPIFSSSRPL